MTNLSESDIKRKFVEGSESGQIDTMKVIYRVTGGPPGKRLEEEMVVSGTNDTRLKMKDETKLPTTQEFSTRLDGTEVRSLFKNIGSGLNSLTPAENARFLPDSVIGSISIEVDNKKSDTYYFLIDEEERSLQGKSVTSDIIEAIKKFEEISKRDR